MSARGLERAAALRPLEALERDIDRMETGHGEDREDRPRAVPGCASCGETDCESECLG